MIIVFIALAGSLGAVTRFMIDGHIRTRRKRMFPWATLFINTTGSFLLGFVTLLAANHGGLANASAIIGVGFCGGYTTFSTASFETVRLLEQRDYKRATWNVVGGITVALVAASLGIDLAAIF